VLQKAELSAQADSENNLGGSSETYVLHRTRCTQEDDQLLREGRGWPCAPGGQDCINSPRTGRVDWDYAAAPHDRHGSNDLHRVDLRPSASARREAEGGAPADAQSYCRLQEEERQD